MRLLQRSYFDAFRRAADRLPRLSLSALRGTRAEDRRRGTELLDDSPGPLEI